MRQKKVSGADFRAALPLVTFREYLRKVILLLSQSISLGKDFKAALPLIIYMHRNPLFHFHSPPSPHLFLINHTKVRVIRGSAALKSSPETYFCLNLPHLRPGDVDQSSVIMEPPSEPPNNHTYPWNNPVLLSCVYLIEVIEVRAKP